MNNHTTGSTSSLASITDHSVEFAKVLASQGYAELAELAGRARLDSNVITKNDKTYVTDPYAQNCVGTEPNADEMKAFATLLGTRIPAGKALGFVRAAFSTPLSGSSEFKSVLVSFPSIDSEALKKAY